MRRVCIAQNPCRAKRVVPRLLWRTPSHILTNVDESAMNQERPEALLVGEFSGSLEVSSRNRLLRFLATNAAGAVPIGTRIPAQACPDG
jgi:hypothetical protein